MVVKEDPRYSRDYLDAGKRSIANAVQVFFRDGSCTEKVELEYPLGHRRRRKEGIPLLLKKCRENLTTRLPNKRMEEVLDLCSDPGRLMATPVNTFLELFLP